jgi:succinyl-CoA synthetase beta subunit
MARLHEYQSKAILRAGGLTTPRGRPVTTPEDAALVASEIGAPVVVKAQAWVTSRAAKKLIWFADTPEAAAEAAGLLLGQQVGNFTVDTVLVEEKLAISREFYLGMIVDDRERRPVVILSGVGGSGIEEIAREHPDKIAQQPVDIVRGLTDYEARELARRVGARGALLNQLTDAAVKFYKVARQYEARSAEINPLVLTESNQIVAADCRFTVDDYAVFRHPDLGIEIARETDRPPTALERIAWNVEKGDYRGTFYFLQLETEFAPDDVVVGFHGSGGGGSMMNMDALLRRGFKIANFVDTSGNPPASKVYRAARIILSQPRVDAYYMGGSGVASQEQFHSARGLVKAFMDTQLNVPAVIRIGGNGEEQAIEILERANGTFPAPVEAYGRDDTPDFCVDSLASLVESYTPAENVPPRPVREPQEPYSFETVTGGTVTYDHALCRDCETKACVQTCVPQILSLDSEVPVLNITREEAKRGGCIECLACEVECHFLGNRGGFIRLPIAGLDEAHGDHH